MANRRVHVSVLEPFLHRIVLARFRSADMTRVSGHRRRSTMTGMSWVITFRDAMEVLPTARRSNYQPT